MLPRKILLASASPRRRELLALLGIEFETAAPQVDEAQNPEESPVDYACRLSWTKAQVAFRADALVVAADTIVVDGSDVLGKPRSPAEAWMMLQRLKGRAHQVHTAIVVWETIHNRCIVDVACSPVWMRAYTDDEVAAYIASGDPFDKAGAYAIQHPIFRPTTKFAHCFANVMGLPVCHVARSLHGLGFAPPEGVAERCQAHLQYQCPVFCEILNCRL